MRQASLFPQTGGRRLLTRQGSCKLAGVPRLTQRNPRSDWELQTGRSSQTDPREPQVRLGTEGGLVDTLAGAEPDQGDTWETGRRVPREEEEGRIEASVSLPPSPPRSGRMD